MKGLMVAPRAGGTDYRSADERVAKTAEKKVVLTVVWTDG
jgi:hypothetical protein